MLNHFIKIFSCSALLLLGACTPVSAPAQTINSSASSRYEYFIDTQSREELNQARAKIGKSYWFDTELVTLYDSPDVSTPYHKPSGKSGSYYGFKIKDVVSSGSSQFFVIETPDGNTKYITLTMQDFFLKQNPRIRQAKAKAECDRKGGVSIGMTAQQVLASCVGKPRHINTTRLPGLIDEQWVYGGGNVYLENGVVKSIQTFK